MAETPFALSLVVGLFFAARKMAATPTPQHRPASVCRGCSRGLEFSPSCSLSIRRIYVHVRSFVRSFAVRSSFVSAPPLCRRRSFSLYQPFSYQSPGYDIPLYLSISTTTGTLPLSLPRFAGLLSATGGN